MLFYHEQRTLSIIALLNYKVTIVPFSGGGKVKGGEELKSRSLASKRVSSCHKQIYSFGHSANVLALKTCGNDILYVEYAVSVR